MPKKNFKKLLGFREQHATRMAVSSLNALLKALEQKYNEDYEMKTEEFKSGYSCCLNDILQVIKNLEKEN